MRPFWEAQFANPASAEHVMGRAVAEAVEAARGGIARGIAGLAQAPHRQFSPAAPFASGPGF
ncbi:MAG: hypothetical protein ACKO9A_00700 [Alphaproteobacteria bacterium]